MAASVPLLDIFALARVNGGKIRDRYHAACERAGAQVARLHRFCERVERDGRMSINTRSKRLLAMLRTGYYLNPYEEARERARVEGGDSEEYLKESQGKWYRKRVAFERSFVGGEAFRYASLNIGGAGLAYYGLYCIVVRDPAEGDRIALLPANSLMLCMSEADEVDDSKLRRELAPWENRHHLTASKHAHEVADVPEDSWSVMMCNATMTSNGTKGSFVEVLMGMPVSLEAIVEIRIAQERLDELMFKLLNDTLPDFERIELNNRILVFEELKKRNLEQFCREV